MARWLLDCHPLCKRAWRLGLATEAKERDMVFRLRYEVFISGEGYGHVATAAGEGRDADSFDDWCDQIILYDTDRDELIGTHRVIPGADAVRREGFYGSEEFDMTPLAPIASQILQGSRTCVASSHRAGPAILYLMYGMELLLREYRCQYFLGQGSFAPDSVDNLHKIASYVRQYATDPDWCVEPRPAYRVTGLQDVPVTPADRRLLPPVIRTELQMGFRVCGSPGWDPEFRSYDLLLLGRRDHLTPFYQSIIDRIERGIPSKPADFTDEVTESP